MFDDSRWHDDTYGVAFTAALGWCTAREASAADVARIVRQLNRQRVAAETVTVQGRSERAPNLDAASQAGSRLGLSLRETPASVELISHDAKQLRGARTLAEALRGAVSVTVDRSSPGAQQRQRR